MDHNNQPTTSKNLESQTICIDGEQNCETNINKNISVVENEVLNESLDAFAKTYNLTAQNVKNILYHVIKNPQTFSTLFGNDPEAITSLRMTRSRQKEFERIAQVNLGIELKPVNPARTFLDVNYDENDDEDVDYRPDETDNVDGEDDNESDFPESTADWGELVDEDVDGMHEQLLTNIDDPEYLNFLKSIATSNGDFPPNDEDDDDEFNIIQQEMELVEEDEFRMDRTTKIPRWELDALRQDWLIADSSMSRKVSAKKHHEPIVENMNCIPKCDVEMAQLDYFVENSQDFSSLNPEALARQFFSSGDKKPVGDCDDSDEVIEVFANVPLKNELASTASTVKEDWSCPLLQKDVDFSDIELDTIRIQMEKHVQLLAQSFIGCQDVSNLTQTKNRSLQLINELNEHMHECNSEDSLFCISNLHDTIYSCKEVLTCEDIDLSSVFSPYYLAPSFKVICVLARSKALKYPHLISDVRLEHFSVTHSNFLPSEQVILALALYQLYNVKHSSSSNVNGKYQLIADYFLPVKTVNQIRYHLKNLRKSTRKSPIYDIILQTEESGILNAKFLLDSEGRGAQAVPPIMWPTKFQPQWLKEIGALYARGLLNVNIMGENGNTYENDRDCVGSVVPSELKKNDKKEQKDEDKDEEIMSLEEQEDDVMDQEANMIKAGILAQHEKYTEPSTSREPMDSALNASMDFTLSAETDSVLNAPTTRAMSDELCANMCVAPSDITKHKSRRKQRVEKCLERLRSRKAREESLVAVVEAMNQDLKQRLFMHEDTLKEIHTLILANDFSVAKIFELLSTKLGGEQHGNVLALIASLAPDAELPLDSPILTDLKRMAYKKALEMIVNSYTYLTGCRSKQGVRNAFKNIKEATEGASSEEIANRLKHHFGLREDDPLWKILRTQIPHEKFNERVEDWQYENVDMDSFQSASNDNFTQIENLKFESINLPYKFDPSDKGRLRLRHGRLTMDHNGRIKTVNVGFTTDCGNTEKDGQRSTLSTTATPWSRKDDKVLLTAFQKFNGDIQKSIDEFLATTKTTTKNVSALEANRRLTFLIGMMRKVQDTDIGEHPI